MVLLCTFQPLQVLIYIGKWINENIFRRILAPAVSNIDKWNDAFLLANIFNKQIYGWFCFQYRNTKWWSLCRPEQIPVLCWYYTLARYCSESMAFQHDSGVNKWEFWMWVPLSFHPFYTFIYSFICVYFYLFIYLSVCHGSCIEVMGQLMRISSLYPAYKAWGLKSYH